MDIIKQILNFNANREPERLQMKYDKMRSNAFSFFRGTCHLFYDQLPLGGVFKSAPLTWVCGDLHLENFGSYKGDNRLVYFDLNDFDEAALAPASWEVIRMLTSIRMWADSISMQAADEDCLCATFVDAYASTLSIGKAYWIERETAHGLIRVLLEDLQNRHRTQFLDGRTTIKGKRRQFKIDGVKTLPVTAEQHATVSAFMKGFVDTQPNPDFYHVIDIARRVAGTGSLGVDRYSVLVEGKGSPNHNYLLDLKECPPSSLAPALKAAKITQPKWKTQAQRVVTIQYQMQAVSMAFLQPVALGEKSLVLRGLQPTEDRVSLDLTTQSLSDTAHLMTNMGQLLAWAHLRSSGRAGSANADELIDYGKRKKWRSKLLDTSHDLAAEVQRDAATFNAAYDDHALTLPA